MWAPVFVPVLPWVILALRFVWGRRDATSSPWASPVVCTPPSSVPFARPSWVLTWHLAWDRSLQDTCALRLRIELRPGQLWAESGEHRLAGGTPPPGSPFIVGQAGPLEGGSVPAARAQWSLAVLTLPTAVCQEGPGLQVPFLPLLFASLDPPLPAPLPPPVHNATCTVRPHETPMRVWATEVPWTQECLGKSRPWRVEVDAEAFLGGSALNPL